MNLSVFTTNGFSKAFFEFLLLPKSPLEGTRYDFYDFCCSLIVEDMIDCEGCKLKREIERVYDSMVQNKTMYDSNRLGAPPKLKRGYHQWTRLWKHSFYKWFWCALNALSQNVYYDVKQLILWFVVKALSQLQGKCYKHAMDLILELTSDLEDNLELKPVSYLKRLCYSRVGYMIRINSHQTKKNEYIETITRAHNTRKQKLLALAKPKEITLPCYLW